MAHLQSRAWGSSRLGGKEERHKDPQSCFVWFKSVSELPLLDLQSHRHVAASSSSGTRSVGTLSLEMRSREKGLSIAGEFSHFFINVTTTVTLLN